MKRDQVARASQAVGRRRHRGRHHPAHAAGDLQLRLLRSAECSPARTTRPIRRRRRSIISLGTDTTDLVITNGYRVWQRSIPIGGNHFTKALTKELKLTFAKAEHLKRNATKAEDPKAVFQAMRPVFSDLLTEIQRSIGFFTSNNRNAKLGEMVALGNPMKLPGLQRFLSQNLDQEVKLIDQFNRLVGGTATASPQFKENQLTFGVAYGLCVQALGKSQASHQPAAGRNHHHAAGDAKKPWAVAAVGRAVGRHGGQLLDALFGLGNCRCAGPKDAVGDERLDGIVQHTQQSDAQLAGLTTKFDNITKTGHSLQSNVDGRLVWLEFFKAFDSALPKDPRPIDERKDTAEDVSNRTELHIERMDCEFVPDLTKWFEGVQAKYVSAVAPAPAAPAAGQPAQADGAVGTGTSPAAQPPAADATGWHHGGPGHRSHRRWDNARGNCPRRPNGGRLGDRNKRPSLPQRPAEVRPQ